MIKDVLDGQAEYWFQVGDSLKVLKKMPDKSVDCVITSPPYWQQRIYEDYDGEITDIIGSEDTPELYVENLMKVIRELKRVLKDEGTFWLNIGDKFVNKGLMGHGELH